MPRNNGNFQLLLAAFVTLAATGIATAAEPFFFIQLSDPQFGMSATNLNFVQETANFEFVIATINRLKPAFVVITGDLVNRAGDDAQIKEYKRVLSHLDSSIPVYPVAGNHDVGNEPTLKSVAAYTNQFGPDHYTFRHADFVGIVLNSSLIQSPKNVSALAAAQESWLADELKSARKQGAHQIVVFQHHSWFLTSADEPDQYFNLPKERRVNYLALFKDVEVKYVFCGHYHRNKIARDGELEIVTTGAVGKPLGGESSGFRIAIVREKSIQHHFYSLGDLPNRVELDLPISAAR